MSELMPGDDVEVWDGDVPGWVPGVLDEISGPTAIGACWVVKTESLVDDLPLTYAVPLSRPELIRRKA